MTSDMFDWPPVLLDLSRLVSRLGRPALTGIDRVELAYLNHFLGSGGSMWGLVRVAGGFALLDQGGCRVVASQARAPDLPARRALVPRLVWRANPVRARAETLAGALAIARCSRAGLAPLLARHLPAGALYLNTGHSNLDARVFDAVGGLADSRSAVLLHDTIPLDYPQFARKGTVEPFAARLRTVATRADLVICNAQATADAAQPHLARAGRMPPIVVAHLGVAPAPQAVGRLPRPLDPARPVFLALGTIEPRKNHDLLLDVWVRLAARLPPAKVPQLALIGARGWADAALLARLDARPAGVVELGPLDDPAAAAVMAQARALLFPSLAEGFGLPLLEAAAAGRAVLASPLPVFRELAGDYPQYLATDAPDAWADAVAAHAATPPPVLRPCPPLPDWPAHFTTLGRALSC